MASINVHCEAEAVYVKPAEIYSGHYNTPLPIQLRIATGGAGQSGLIRALADAFITDIINKTGCEPFSVVWLASDTSQSFNYLASKSADLAITYLPAAERIAILQGVANRCVYAWRDHWMLVGPTSNPARLSTDPSVTIHEHFEQIFMAAVSTASSPHPVKFLSRYDKSANNIKETSLWASIGQTPWSHPYSIWYHMYVEFPFQALRAASQLGEYTLVDRGTWCSIEESVRERMMVFKAGGDEDGDLLLNPAHALVATDGKNKDMANAFADWMVAADGGQRVIESFAVGGEILYSKAPS